MAQESVCSVNETLHPKLNVTQLAKLILTFFPLWSIRCDVVKFVNVHGSDDVKTRFYLLCMVVLLVST